MTKVSAILKQGSSVLQSSIKTAHNDSGLRSILGTASYEIYQYQARRFSEIKNKSELMYFTKINNVEDDYFIPKMNKKLTDPNNLDIKNLKVMKVSKQDILLNKAERYGRIILASQDDITINYGDEGVAPSADKRPINLLKYSLTIPPKSFGFIDAKNQVPFLIKAKDPKNTFIASISELEEVFKHEDNIKRYSLNHLSEMQPDDAMRHTIEIKRKIYNDPRKQKFFEEQTALLYGPDRSNKNSGTLMYFGGTDYEGSGSTAMHFHPGERSLIIFTTKKVAGVTLNFCGTSENPDERKDCSVQVPFPMNSILVLNFPSYTHHKFYGDFVCLSVHPREGNNIIDAVNSENPRVMEGFLKFATVISSTDKMHEKWSSGTDSSISNSKDNPKSISR